MDRSQAHEGGCLCGAVRYRFATGTPDVNVCYCRSCRLATGAPVVAFVDLAPGEFMWTAGEPAFHASSPGVRRGFCPRCGSALTYESEAEPGAVHVLSATLDDPTPFPPTREFFPEERISWLRARIVPMQDGSGR